MPAALDVLMERGLSVEARAGRLIVAPADKLNGKLRTFIREHKGEILRTLRLRATFQHLAADSPGTVLSASPVSEAEVAARATDGMVTCVRCRHLTEERICRAKSTADVPYTPLDYEPVLLWRRCDQHLPARAPHQLRQIPEDYI